MERPLVSVIVPVYNAAEYLKTTVEGLCSQTYRNLEILLVNDGSTDDSPKVCRELADADSRVRVIDRENGGVSAARNSGLEAASGELIAFCDSDDYPCPTMIEHLVNIMDEYGCDAVHQRFIMQQEDKTDFTAPAETGEVNVKNTEESVKWLLTKKEPYGNAVWANLLKRSVTEGVTFPLGVAVGEDKFFVLKAYMNCKNVAFYEGREYIYVVRCNSIVHDTFSEKHLSSINNANEILALIEREHPEYTEYAVVNKYKNYLSNISHIRRFDRSNPVMAEAYKEIITFLKGKKPDYIYGYLSKNRAFELRLISFSVPLYRLYTLIKSLAAGILKR